MRYAQLLLAAAVLLLGFSACNNDEAPAYPTPYTGKMEMQLQFSTLPAAATASLACAPQAAGIAIPAQGLIQGYANLIDEVNPRLSPYSIERCYLKNAQEVVEVISGTITSSGGDTFRYRGEMVLNFASHTIGGAMTILEGSGRMEGASGTIHTSGTLNPDSGIASWTGFGTIAFYPND